MVSHTLSKSQIDGIAEDLRGKRCNVDVRQEEEGEKNWLLLVGCNANEIYLLEADIQEINAKYDPYCKNKLPEHLHKNIARMEV